MHLFSELLYLFRFYLLIMHIDIQNTHIVCHLLNNILIYLSIKLKI